MEEREGVTLSVAVANLKAKEAKCVTARRLATVVAKDLLEETKVPARISGFNVTVKAPCTGCTPNTQVVARSGEELITFTVKGGA
jgi:putative NADH-flavin reductase